MRNLWPPIGVIESRLQPGKGEIHSFPDQPPLSEQDAASSEMPAFIRDRIRQRIASRNADFDAAPTAGQIKRFDGEEAQAAPLSVLLNAALGNERWQGWIVSPETDYASHRDVLLEPADEPFDPVAAMVQTWNPVEVDIRKADRTLAQLSPERLDAIREVAAGRCDDGGGARAGFVAPLNTHEGKQVLAGTRITHPEDPRRDYQSLYRNAAQQLQQAQQPVAQVIQLGEKRTPWRNAGWAIAATLVLGQSILIGNLMQNGPGNEYLPPQSEYRALPTQEAGYVYLEVYFKADAKEIEIRKLLMELDATIVDGPGEFGQWRLRLPKVDTDNSLLSLRNSRLLDSAILK